MRASIIIPTRGRGAELRVLLRSLRAQSVPLEVLVMDDGDSDETKALVETTFPEVTYHRLGFSKGPTFQRNRGIELASCPICFPFDDDTELPHPRTIEQTLSEFDDPRIGAVGLPFINVRQDQVVRQRAPGEEGTYLIHAFVGAAHAVRRNVFLSVGGYREHFFYMGEEGDLCIRMLQAGHVTIAGRADVMHHFESPRRSMARADFYGRRNDILFVWHNAPLLPMAAHLPGTTVRGLIWAMTVGRYRDMLRGAASGYLNCAICWHERQPVGRDIYALHRRLKRNVFTELTSVEAVLHEIAPRAVAAEGPVRSMA